MVIDAHYHPLLFEELCGTEAELAQRREELAYYKMAPYSAQRAAERIAAAGVDRCFLLPYDYRSLGGGYIDNAAVQHLCSALDDRFIGFASVDPLSEEAAQDARHALETLGLAGLKLNLAKFSLYPDDKRLYPVYEVCATLRKPIIFHSGMCWQPGVRMQYGHPERFEAVALDFPGMRICLAHFAFPWTREAAALMLRYPNVYADTAMLYFDSAMEFYRNEFTAALPVTWIDRSLRRQVMFGSNMPRFEQMRMLDALQALGLRPDTVECITHKNALEFIGGGEVETW